MQKNVKKWVAIGLMVMTTAALAGCGGSKDKDQGDDATASGEMQKIGVVQLAEHLALDRAREGFVEGLADEGLVEGENVEITVSNAQGDQSNLATISQGFASDEMDLVCAIATPAAVAMASASETIPIVGTAITDYEAAKLVESNDAPGGNVTGTSDLADLELQMDLMTEVMPEMKTLGIIYSTAEENSRVQADMIKEMCAERNIEVKEQKVSTVNDIQQQATELVKDVDAIFAPTDNIISSAMSNLIGVTDEAGIPVFCGEAAQVENGALATRGIDYHALGVQTGKMAAQILRGEKEAKDMPVEHAENFQVTINKANAEKLGIDIPEKLLENADVI